MGEKMAEQHNHHCLITAGGKDWWIEKAMLGHLKITRHVEGGYFISTFLDITKVDWESYIKKAVEMDNEKRI